MTNKFLQIKKIVPSGNCALGSLEQALEQQAVIHSIDQLNWPEFPYRPNIGFRIGHTGNLICLKYYVSEKHIRAIETRTNGNVYKDSCVEFFFSADGENYYNFEFNCIGTTHVAYGPGRHNRRFLPEETISQIKISSTLGDKPFDTRSGKFDWELLAVIPTSTLIYHPGLKLEGLTAFANFYKCGDDLPEPHFVSWNPVNTPQPDYHRPEFFGKIAFEE